MTIKQIKILVINDTQDFKYKSNNYVEYKVCKPSELKFRNINSNNGIILLEKLDIKQLNKLKKIVDKYKVFYCDKSIPTKNSPLYKDYINSMKYCCANYFDYNNLYNFISNIYSICNWDYNGGNYGNIYYRIDEKINAKIKVLGSNFIEFEGNFGNTFRRCAYGMINFNRANNEELEFWPEFQTKGNIKIEYRINLISAYNIDKMLDCKKFSGKDLDKPITYKNQSGTYADMYLSVYVKGSGKLKLGPFQARVPRHGYGTYVLGGKSHTNSNREEIISYFDPGNYKPPLNIYFAGFHTAKGFEGYHMMKSFKSPFLLISDMRQSGGEFYLGSAETEKIIIDEINRVKNLLKFNNEDITMSGLSMGTTGALYYSKYFDPKAIFVGKPLVNLSYIAKNYIINRPDDFGAGLDMFMDIVQNKKISNFGELDNIVYNQLCSINDHPMSIYSAYMNEDDYDNKAMNRIYKALETKNKISVFAKGFTGRHNDDTAKITNWFKLHYKMFLENEYLRKY